MSRTYSVWLKIGVVVAGLFLLSQVTSIYLPIILAVVLAFILNPAVNLFSRFRLWPARFHIPRGLAVILAIIVALLAIGAGMFFIFFPFVAEFDRFVANLPALLRKIQNLTGVLEARAHDMEVPEAVRAVADHALTTAVSYALAVGRRLLDSTVGFASQVVELVVVPVLTYYFLKDWRELKESVVEVLPSAARGKARLIIEEMAAVVSAYIRGQALVSIIIGFLVFLGMYFLDVGYPLVLGLLATLTETIPIIGPIIGATPALFLAYLNSPALALKVLIFFLVIHQLENHIVVPKIMGHTIALHPVVVIISLLIGGQLLGVVGMILSVPVAALLKVLLKHLWHNE
ncbi:MAG TPA: AI-2E family transporter [Selenomonadales bacterium]|nr:AI-2E family transporter [Selenomonadales bacterium]